MPRRLPLVVAIALSIGAVTAHAQQPTDAQAPATDPRTHERPLEEITVTARPLSEPGAELIRPVSVLAGSALEDQRAPTLGETLSRVPGVQSSWFGPGVGRPIIRGLDAGRVAVLSGGLSTLDVSTISADHAVTIEPFLAEQIEILRGPATLLYGSGAIGGVVNVVDGRIPSAPVDGVDGRAEIGRNSVDSSHVALAKLRAGDGRWAVTVDIADRDGDDFRAPGGGEIENTARSARSAGLGLGWTGETGWAGLSVTRFESRYGIPFAEDDDDDDVGFGPRSLAKGGEGKAVALDMEQTRLEGRFGLRGIGAFDKIEASLVRSDYEHVEIELEDNEIGTRFTNDAHEGRVVGELAAIGPWRSAMGLQFGKRRFSAIGEEAFVPPSQTADLGLFGLAEASFDPWRVEFGARVDDVESRLRDGSLRADHRPKSLAFGAAWDFTPGWHLTLNLDRAQRAPSLEELYSDGPHAATGSYEIGDPALEVETARHGELALHFHGDRLEARVSTYATRFSDFIYLRDTGEFFEDDDLALAKGPGEDELPIYQWTQADARFSGFEAEAKLLITDGPNGRFDLRGFADGVRGRLREGGNLPRIAPGRFGAGIEWSLGPWRASLDGTRWLEQDRVAEEESETPGFNRVDAHVSYAFAAAGAEWEVYLDARNLTDSTGRLHTSFLKDVAPLPGRGYGFGIRAYF
jgi:iron complex outermembrane receptor protein